MANKANTLSDSAQAALASDDLQPLTLDDIAGEDVTTSAAAPTGQLPNPFQSATGNSMADREADVKENAPFFTDAVKRIIGMYDGACSRAVEATAKRSGYPDESAEAFGDAVSLSAETKAAATTAISRIAARRCKSPEIMDWVCLAGALAEHQHQIQATIADIKRSAPGLARASMQLETEPAKSNGAKTVFPGDAQ